jgi:lipopolysaccharide biosynthesis regulator YciM
MGELTLHIWGMELSVQVLLVTVALLGGVSGYYLGKRKVAQESPVQRSNPPESSTAFSQGINYILANEPDLAIEALTRAVQINSETVETYVALGNLFRSKGEIDKAIRIRQSILLRPKVDRETRLQALYDLGMDYKRGGFLQRAISAFEELIDSAPQRLDAHVQVETLFEATCDWQRAYELQLRIAKLKKSNENHVLAHIKTEQAKNEMKAGDLDAAKAHLKKALKLDHNCVDARLQLGELYWLKNKQKKALDIWRTLIRNSPPWAHLVLARLQEKEGRAGEDARILEILEALIGENLDAVARLALARCLLARNRRQQGLGVLRLALEMEPDLWEARKLLGEALLEESDVEGALREYGKILLHLQPPVKRYRCQQCGLETDEVQWKCLGCQRWDTIQPISTAGTSNV